MKIESKTFEKGSTRKKDIEWAYKGQTTGKQNKRARKAALKKENTTYHIKLIQMVRMLMKLYFVMKMKLVMCNVTSEKAM
jgi:hypothetical protein